MQGKGKGGKQGLGSGVGWVGSLGCAVRGVAYEHMWGAYVEQGELGVCFEKGDISTCGEHMWSRGAEREQVRGLQYRVGALISSPSQK